MAQDHHKYVPSAADDKKKKGGTLVTEEIVMESMKTMGDLNLDTANRLIALVFRTGSHKLLMSPLAVQISLMMVYLAARGKTSKEIATFYGITSSRTAKMGFRLLTSMLNDHPRLKLYSRIFYDLSVDIEADYERRIQTYLGAGVWDLDFRTSPEASWSTINKVILCRSKGHLKKSVPKGLVTSKTKLLVMSSLYFHGLWEHPFDRYKSGPGSFHLSTNNAISVWTMYGKEKFGYKEELQKGFSVLELPFVNNVFVMFVVMPNHFDNIDALEVLLGELPTRHLFLGLEYNTMLEVSLPVFRVQQTLDTSDMVKQLGIQRLFQPLKADLGHLLTGGSPPTCVTTMLQTIAVRVDDEVDEDAPIESRFVDMKAMGREVQQFAVNRPFFFFICHVESEAILLVGKVHNGSNLVVLT